MNLVVGGRHGKKVAQLNDIINDFIMCLPFFPFILFNFRRYTPDSNMPSSFQEKISIISSVKYKVHDLSDFIELLS